MHVIISKTVYIICKSPQHISTRLHMSTQYNVSKPGGPGALKPSDTEPKTPPCAPQS